MYVDPNFQTKKALKDAVKQGDVVTVYSPGPFPCPKDGIVPVEGPHYPKPHKWWAEVEVRNGHVVKVRS